MKNETTQRENCEFDLLAILIDDDQNHPSYQSTLAHVENCDHCQQNLETIAGDESWWNRAADFLAEPTPGTLDIRATSATHGSSSKVMLIDSAVQAAVHPVSDSVSKACEQVLDPPRHPEMLGRLGNYDIERMIGRGGMGVVFKGFDHELNRPVAIKIMAPHLASSGVARKRFAREARAAAAVVHPQVVPIYGVESSQENPYLVMPFISGNSLQHHVDASGPLETKELVRAAMHVASGLAAAHAQGLVHRDVKPANILVDQNISRVMITDFGLARAADDVAMTQTGWLAGTPHYMSPEQASGKSIDARSDLFSLGSVMYFLATGRMPFRAEVPMAVLNKIVHESPQPVRDINPEVPRRLCDIIMRLLEKNADDRFENASDLQSHLSIYLAHLQQPRVYPAPKRATSRRKRMRFLRNTAIVLSLAIVAPIAGWFVAQYASPSIESPQQAITNRESPLVEDGSGIKLIATETSDAETKSTFAEPIVTEDVAPNFAIEPSDAVRDLIPDLEFERQLQQLESDAAELRLEILRE